MVAGAGVATRDTLRELDGLEGRLALLDRRISLAEWALYNGRGDERASVAWQTRRARFLRSPASGRVARRLSGPLGSPLLERRVELLRRDILDAHVEQSPEVVRLRMRLQGRIVRFRPLWHGKHVGRSDIYEVLRSSPDRAERERAWRAEEPLRHRLEGPLARLIELRNELAREAGYRNFAVLRLGFEGVPPPALRSLAAAATRGVRSAAGALRSEVSGRSRVPGWAPWDVRYALEQRAKLPAALFPAARMVGSVRRALAAWGFPARRSGFRLVRREMPFAGLTFPIVVPGDVRILVHPKGGWEYYGVLFHEYGHATHFAGIDQPSHLLRTTDPGYAGFAEGVAGVFEKVAEDPNWLATVEGLDPARSESFARQRKSAGVLEAGLTSLAVESELGLYERPGRNPLASSHARARRQLGYDDYEDRSWAEPFFVTHPVYLQSYLLAQLFRAQVAETMTRATSGPFWPNPRAGPWLAESFFAPGARYDWTERLADVSGSPLSAEPFVRAVSS